MLRIVSVSAVLVAGVCASSALLAGGQAWAFDDEDDEEGPAEYVRICDAYGTGFFYIPGTETCLRISGGVRYSGIQQPSLLGASTTVIGGSEGFTVPAANWINRWGGDVSWEYGLGKNRFGDSFLGSYDAYLFGEAEFATGRANATGSSVVGVGGVTQIGLTHGMAIGGVTGIGSTLAGDGVTERNWVGSTWVRGMFGAGKSFLGDDDDDEGPPAGFYVTPRLGLFVEHLNFSSQGRADITRGGAILAGFYQDYRSYAGDTYLGTVIGADLHYQVSPSARLTIGADILPAYHWGGANIDMQIGTGGGGAVNESYAFDKAGFTLGVSARAGVEFALARGWNAGIDYQWSLIPGVTALDKPAGPAFQPITATGRSVNRHEISLRLQRQF